MEFQKYQHVERLGTVETDGILNGTCYVFPKIDGSNCSVWNDNGVVKAGSRNRELSLENDHAGFYEWVLAQPNIIALLTQDPSIRLYGEWLVPHTIKTYQKDAWRKFYVFDVMFNTQYMNYEAYKLLLDIYHIDYIPPICKVMNPTEERLINYLQTNTYLIEDGKGVGEGIVIKNYDYENRYGRVVWAKIVSNEFKSKMMKGEVRVVTEKSVIEEQIANKYASKTLVEKEYAKIVTETGGWSSKLIPRLLNMVYYNLIKEESWNFIKEFKNPTINYSKLKNAVIQQIKILKPELF